MAIPVELVEAFDVLPTVARQRQLAKVLHSIPNPVLLIRSSAESAPADEVEVKTVLVPLDGSQLSQESLSHASTVAAGLSARITLIQVTGTTDLYRRYLDRAPAEEGLTSAEDLVQADSEDAKASPVVASRRLAREFGFGDEVVVRHLQGQNPAEAIVEMAGAEPTMVVMTTHRRSVINRLVLGSVTDRVVRHANAPALVVRRHDEPGAIGMEARVSEGFSAGFGDVTAQPAWPTHSVLTGTQFHSTVIASKARQSRRGNGVSSGNEVAASLRSSR